MILLYDKTYSAYQNQYLVHVAQTEQKTFQQIIAFIPRPDKKLYNYALSEISHTTRDVWIGKLNQAQNSTC